MPPPQNKTLSNNGELPKGTPCMHLRSKGNETNNVVCIDFHRRLEEGLTPCPTYRSEKKEWLRRALSDGRAQCPKAGRSHFLQAFCHLETSRSVLWFAILDISSPLLLSYGLGVWRPLTPINSGGQLPLSMTLGTPHSTWKFCHSEVSTGVAQKLILLLQFGNEWIPEGL